MTFSHTISWNAYSSAGNISVSKSFEGDVQANLDLSIPTATTNQEVLLALDVSALKTVIVSSDVAVTIKTNNSGSPTDTIAIKAGIPYIWHYDAYASNLFTGDVSKIFITNTSGSTSNFKLLALTDTP